MEELRAELASAFMASELGIPADIPQHASYIADWITPLKEDKREIFRVRGRCAEDLRSPTFLSSRFSGSARTC